MAWRGLRYKGVEILTPEDWNTMLDCLNDLYEWCTRGITAGKAEFTGNGIETKFEIPHGLGKYPTVCLVGKGAPNLPDIDHWTADDTKIYVNFKTAPPADSSVVIWWLAILL